MQIMVDEYEEPGKAIWAPYLINGDSSGLHDSDIDECNAWLESISDEAHVVVTLDNENSYFDGHADMINYTIMLFV